jgi:hypothetical protein
MSNTVTLEQVEAMAAQLSPRDRLKLVAHVCDQLSASPPLPMSEAEYAAWEKECEEVAELWEGEFDSAADLRRIRDED